MQLLQCPSELRSRPGISVQISARLEGVVLDTIPASRQRLVPSTH
jgi:hypothetical protein